MLTNPLTTISSAHNDIFTQFTQEYRGRLRPICFNYLGSDKINIAHAKARSAVSYHRDSGAPLGNLISRIASGKTLLIQRFVRNS